MPKAGWCAQCGANVWLLPDGGCQNGHDASQVSNVYEVEPQSDPLRDVADTMEQAARQAGDAVKGAWHEAQPAAKEAADAAGEAARKAGAAAKGFGQKLLGHSDKQTDSPTSDAESIDTD